MTTVRIAPTAGFLRSVVLLGRPKFLVIGLLMHVLGVAAAFSTTGTFDLPLFVIAQLGVSCLQLMTNYSNDFFDLHVDRLNATFTRWTGGSRMLVNGRVSPGIALTIALVLVACFVGALACAWWLRHLLFPKVPAMCWVLALVGLALAWGYSAPPLRLSSRGLGEAVVAATISVILPAIGFFLQGGIFKWEVALALLPLYGIHYTRMIIFNIADAKGDAAGGKRTLVVRLGVENAVRVYQVVQMVSYASLPVLALLGVAPKVLLGILCIAPLAILQTRRLMQRAWLDETMFNRLTSTSTIQYLTTGLAITVGFIL